MLVLRKTNVLEESCVESWKNNQRARENCVWAVPYSNLRISKCDQYMYDLSELMYQWYANKQLQ